MNGDITLVALCHRQRASRISWKVNDVHLVYLKRAAPASMTFMYIRVAQVIQCFTQLTITMLDAALH